MSPGRELTPKRLAAMEAAQAAAEAEAGTASNGDGNAEVVALPITAAERLGLDETASPTPGRPFKRG